MALRLMPAVCLSVRPAVCEGNFTCKENEVCVRPGECRCRHGYFGANCDTSEYRRAATCPRRGSPGWPWGHFPERSHRGWGCGCSCSAVACPAGVVPRVYRPFGGVSSEIQRTGRLLGRGGTVVKSSCWDWGSPLVASGGVVPRAAPGLTALPAECPRQFWGPDCKEMCSCHPNGQCEDVTGQCTCNPNRWGPKCENVCLCKHGKCDQKTGKCTCEPNWWGPQCSSSCYCSHNSQCDQQTGNCLCQPGWWGRGCNNQCSCNNSPCEQFTGRCQCRERTFGPRCDRYCQCYKGKCNQVDGTCTCEPGYRGKYCREPCPAGFYGQGCRRR